MMMFILCFGLLAIGCFFMFNKSGETDTKKAVIPFFNIYHMFKMYWDGSVFFLYIGAMIIGFLLMATAKWPLMVIGFIFVVFCYLCQFLLGRFIVKAFDMPGYLALIFALWPPIVTCYIGLNPKVVYVKSDGDEDTAA